MLSKRGKREQKQAARCADEALAIARRLGMSGLERQLVAPGS
jgi:hypothetical protein